MRWLILLIAKNSGMISIIEVVPKRRVAVSVAYNLDEDTLKKIGR